MERGANAASGHADLVIWIRTKLAMTIGAKPTLEAAVGLNRFMRIETFGRSPRRRDRKWRDILEILGEAGQGLVGAAGLAEPKPPKLLLGAAPQSLAPEAQRLATAAVDSRGWKLRGDVAILVAGVASFPVEQRIFERDLIERETYRFWCATVLRWLQDTFGESLRCVVERKDERDLRLHFYTLPSLTGAALIWAWRRSGGPSKSEQIGRSRSGNTGRRCAALTTGFTKRSSRTWGRDRFGPVPRRVARRERPVGRKWNGSKLEQTSESGN
jgi:hypothetical protein